MKKRVLTLLFALLTLTSFADEGMWLPSLISSRIEDMRSKGFELTADDIYSINQASMKDAVVLFGGGCTGELISAEGLLLTNHHCGYGAIQQHSTVEHDYLTNGFWAMSKKQELPNEKLNVRFLVRMEDITERLAGGEKSASIVKAVGEEGVGYKGVVEQMYYGNQQFLFVYQQFDDVRLVGAPPSSIGKFGGDTDNWMWPRHTGDFSLFRIYANKDNEPASYSAENVPYTPKQSLTISTEGVEEGDFTMIYGFPGNTQIYILSDAVDYIAERSNPTKIDIRTKRLDIMKAAQDKDPAARIYYAARHASVANAWKKWEGEALGLRRLATADQKRSYESAFKEWAKDSEKYATVVDDLKVEYARIMDGYFARELISETLKTLPFSYSEKVRSNPIFETIKGVDGELFRAMFEEYNNNTPKEYMVDAFQRGVEEYGSAKAYADVVFGEVVLDNGKESKRLRSGLTKMLKRISKELGTSALRNLNSKRLSELYTIYISGLREWDTERAFFPDANLTLRVAYGSVGGYDYTDGVYHNHLTTLDGIIAKDDPNIYDYDIPESLRKLYAAKDYGRWGIEVDGKVTVPVCFLASNQTTGGNSGSPILNKRGELVGLNFDRTWRSTMSDVAFDPTICRNISVDIRYVLFVIDRVGGASYLFDEMTLK